MKMTSQQFEKELKTIRKSVGQLTYAYLASEICKKYGNETYDEQQFIRAMRAIKTNK